MMLHEELYAMARDCQARTAAKEVTNWSNWLSILIEIMQEWLAQRGTPVKLPYKLKHASTASLTTDESDQQMIDFIHLCAATMVRTESETPLLEPSRHAKPYVEPAPPVKTIHPPEPPGAPLLPQPPHELLPEVDPHLPHAAPVLEPKHESESPPKTKE